MDDRYPGGGGGGGGHYGAPPEITGPSPSKATRKSRRQPPQAVVAAFWDQFNTKHPGKVLTILPDNTHARSKAARTPHGAVRGQRAARSYEQARAECTRDVERIVRECRRINQKYRDPHFDIEWDLKSGRRNCLDGLKTRNEEMRPKGVGRVTDIFEKPEFYINGPTAGDVRQGRDGDCYFMAALCGLGNMKGEPLIHKVCVKHDQAVGVYGFVFFRDGEWQQTIVDDKLYLRAPDYEEAHEERRVWDEVNRTDTEEEYRKAHQTGSRALYFAQCSDENETWLPLLEKAYAKAHGDYSSIDGGFTGEAIEDLTGGVTAEIYSTDILDRDKFWREELMQVGRDFLFGCATGFYSNWLDPTGVAPPRERQGISEGHAYSIMDAVEIKGQRLLKLRNPWGKKEWDGRWSDGSEQWTAEWMALLDHKFGNDGVFWISYEDLLRKYQHFDRTRIFGDDWSVTQTWTAVHVPWVGEYLNTKFRVTLKEKGNVVIVLAQLDDTYFGGLEGAYGFDLQFRLEEDQQGQTADREEGDYIVRSNGNYAMARSVSTDIELEAGRYLVLMKITARKTGNEELEDVLPDYAASRREKLIQMGLSYDLAHAKGVVIETEREKSQRLEREKARKVKDREKLKAEMRKQAEKDWKKRKGYYEREKKRREKKMTADAKRTALGRGSVGDGSQGGAEENVDSLDVVDGGGSDRDGEAAVRTNGEVRRNVRKDRPLPLRLKSFGGEDILVGANRPSKASLKESSKEAATDDEQASVAAAVSETVSNLEPPSVIAQPSADGIVQPLDEVIKEANEPSAAATLASAGDGKEQMKEDTGNDTEKEAEKEKDADFRPPTPKIQVNGVDAVTDVKPLPSKPPISSPEHTDPTSTAIEPFAFAEDMSDPHAETNGTGEAARDPSERPRTQSIILEEHETPTDDGDDTSSFPDFDWRSDLDMPTDTSSSSDSDAPTRRRKSQKRNEVPDDVMAKDDDAGDISVEPWNAVCVVGLRVYSLLKGEDVKVEVVRPVEDDEEDEDGEGNGGGEVKVLDRDDMNKGAAVAEAVGGSAGGEGLKALRRGGR